MGWARSKYGGEKRRGVYRDLVGNMRERDYLGKPSVHGRIIIRLIFRKWGVDWIELTQDRDRWRGLVNAVMNLQVP
jgi:hypothetical protein